MKIRIRHINKLVEMPNGEYARSEGDEVTIKVTYCHPGDYRHLIHKNTGLNIAFNAIFNPDIPEWVSDYLDFLEWGEDNAGSPLEDKIDAIDNEIRQWMSTHFSTPEWVEVKDEIDSSWKKNFHKRVLYKERINWYFPDPPTSVGIYPRSQLWTCSHLRAIHCVK